MLTNFDRIYDQITKYVPCQHHHDNRLEHHGRQPNGIVPRDLLRHIADSEAVDETTRARARRDLDSLPEFVAPEQEVLAPASKTAPYRYVYDDHHTKVRQSHESYMTRFRDRNALD